MTHLLTQIESEYASISDRCQEIYDPNCFELRNHRQYWPE